MSNINRIMVCVTQQKSCERLIEKGMEFVKSKEDELHVIHVVKENWKYFGQLREADALEYLFDVSKTHGASLTVLKAKDIEATLSHFADQKEIDTIVMGESLESSEQQNMINRLRKEINRAVRFDVIPIEDIPYKVG